MIGDRAFYSGPMINDAYDLLSTSYISIVHVRAWEMLPLILRWIASYILYDRIINDDKCIRRVHVVLMHVRSVHETS